MTSRSSECQIIIINSQHCEAPKLTDFNHFLSMISCSEVFNSVLLLFFLPEGEVLLKELNDRLGISEGFFIDIIDLLEGIRQGLFSEGAGLLMVVHNFVVEDGEVECESKSNWVASVQALGSLLCEVVVLEGTMLDGVELISGGALGDVSIVVTHHLVEEGLGLFSGGDSHTLVLDNFNDVHALVVKFLFDPLFVDSKGLIELRIFRVLLDGTDGSDGSSL